MGNPLAEGGSARLGGLLDNLLDASAGGMFAYDRALRLTVFNAAMERALGLSRERVLGAPVLEAAPALQRLFDETLLMGALHGVSFPLSRRLDPLGSKEAASVEGGLFPIRDERGEVVGGLGVLRWPRPEAVPGPRPEDARELAERLAAAEAELERARAALLAEMDARVEFEKREEALFSCGKALAEPVPASKAIERVLELACRALGFDLGELWLAEAKGGLLRWETLWHDPALDARTFEKEAWAAGLLPGEDFIGRAAAVNGAVYAADLWEDEAFGRSLAAKKAGLRRGLAAPFRTGGAVRGVLALYSREAFPPGDEALQLVAELARQLGLFLERRRAEEERDRLFGLSPAMLCLLGGDGRVLRINPAWELGLGWRMQEVAGRELAELAHPEDRERTREGLRRAALQDGSSVFELRLLGGDGRPRRLRISAAASQGERRVFAAAQEIV